MINALRENPEYQGILANRKSMAACCPAYPASAMQGNYTTEYAFRVNTENYAYVMRLNPTKGDYNFYVYCFEKKWLDRHIADASRGIRFITPHYKEKFRIGGKSALDYLIKVKNYSFIDAVGIILGRAAEMPPVSHSEPNEKEKKLLLPPPKEGYPFRVVQYLLDRGIDRRLIDYCVKHNLLYESEDYHNAVFVGYDASGVARYAALRSTTGAYKGEATGSDKHYSFSLCLSQEPEQVHVFESAIDLLSYATLEQRAGRSWTKDALLSLAGVFKQKREKVIPVALAQFLADHPCVQRVYLHLDNDEVGRSAAKGIMEGLADQPYDVVNLPPRCGNDVNDQLLWELLHQRRNEPER